MKKWTHDNPDHSALMERLDGMEPEPRVEFIDDLIHVLNFERRMTLLTPNQLEAMNEDLSDPQRKRLEKVEGTPKFDELIKDFARTTYFCRCAWIDYLNNGGDPPIQPKSNEESKREETKVAQQIPGSDKEG